MRLPLVLTAGVLFHVLGLAPPVALHAQVAPFLVGFCGDPDTACGADEVGRAVLIFVVPTAAAGALIGSLVRTER